MYKFLFSSIVPFFLLGCESKPIVSEENILLDDESTVESLLGATSPLIGQSADIDLDESVVFIYGKVFNVEIANNSQKRREGLMNRDFMDEDAGMLFVFGGENIFPFWMKNTFIPLTIIWLDKDGVVVDAQDAYPCEKDPCPNYVPRGEAQYVLEVNQGVFE